MGQLDELLGALARIARGPERVDICIQPELNFASSPEDRARPQTALVPVASLADRRWAGLLDAIFLALTCAGFVGLFHSLGGQLTVFALINVVNFFAVYQLGFAAGQHTDHQVLHIRLVVGVVWAIFVDIVCLVVGLVIPSTSPFWTVARSRPLRSSISNLISAMRGKSLPSS